MILSRSNLNQIHHPEIEMPGEDCFRLPEKVLQFGTGVLLRGLPDYFIDKANRQHLFNGRIVVVKSTGSGEPHAFKDQDNLYTVCIRGIEGGKKIEKNIIHSAISRVLSAGDHWNEILRCAENPEMQIVISNTTEVGIALSDDGKDDAPPASFPGKLLAFLYRRYNVFQGDPSRGMVIIPTELILDNADRLRAILGKLAEKQGLESAFIQWLGSANYFCNSLVDCIVPGKKPGMDTRLGYTDDLLIMTEVYRLWAIQCSGDHVKKILSFAAADERVVIAPDIESFRELKLRLLNGSHSFSCALALMADHPMVREAVEAPVFNRYLRELMMEEIVPVISGKEITTESATAFANQVIDRFQNPYIDHYWINISLQYSTKMAMRNVPLIMKYTALFKKPPERMCLGFAAYLLFMRSEKKADGNYYGRSGGKEYPIRDDYAAYFSEGWKAEDTNQFLLRVLKNQDLWGTDLSVLPGFAPAVQKDLHQLMEHGAAAALQQITQP